MEGAGSIRREVAGRDSNLVAQEVVRRLRARGTMEVRRAGDDAQGEPLQQAVAGSEGVNSNSVGRPACNYGHVSMQGVEVVQLTTA